MSSTHDSTTDESKSAERGQDNPHWKSDAEGSIDDYHAAGAPTGWLLGERTEQAWPGMPEGWKGRDDFYEMRKLWGISQFDVESFTDVDEGCVVYPDIIRHRRNPTKTPSSKGTDALIRGRKDSGKTTYLKTLAVRLGENNDERIVHRGRPDDSGWLEMRWWTTLWLPENASIDATWVYERDEQQSRAPVDDLEEIVRDVKYYSDVYDLVDALSETPMPSYHVVYPDPSFSGCERAMRETNKVGEVLPYIPKWETEPDQSPTPLPQWWIAFILVQLEHGHFDGFMSWICDEAHQVFGPPNPSQDDHSTPQKFDLAGQLLNEARKRMFSWYLATQSEGKIDYRILGEVTTRLYLADGRPNPTTAKSSSHPYGWDTVPMDGEFMSDQEYRALCFIESKTSGFAEITWDDLDPHPDDENRWLQINLREPDQQVKTTSSDVGVSTATLEYDEQFFGAHEQTNYLDPLPPGSGRIDLAEPSIVDDLEAPPDDEVAGIATLAFENELRKSDDGKHWEVRGEVGKADANGGVQTREVTFVRIPADGYRFGGSAGGGT